MTSEPKLVSIPSGKLRLGQPPCPDEASLRHPWHSDQTVEVRAFKIGQYLVTNREYRDYLKATDCPAPSHIDRTDFNAEDQPVVGISWLDAQAYCQWLVAQTGKPYRLPTDAEWEYTAQGREQATRFPWGDELSSKHCCYGGLPAPKPVGSYSPNGFDVYDIVGNAWEWCADRFNDVARRSEAVNTPTDQPPQDNRVLRGGSYMTVEPLNLWVAYRHEDPMDLRHESLGFRVAQ